MEKIANEFLPFPTEYRFALPGDMDVTAAKHTINQQANRLHMRWNWDPEVSAGLGEATGNIWSRAYRREYERKKKELAASGAGDAEMKDGIEDTKVALAFRIEVLESTREVVLSWLRGSDHVLWESFCGMVHRSFRKS